MLKRTIALLLALMGLTCLAAQTEKAERPTLEALRQQLLAMSDSLQQARETEIVSEYGFRDTDRLQDVAAKLKIANVPQWKKYLEIEPENPVLDKMSLAKLGISPYRALLAQQYSIYGFTELSTLGNLARQKQLPVKKIRQFAGISSEDKSRDSYSLQALNIKPDEFVAFERDFNVGKIGFGFSVTFIGITIVFAALAITALIIGQLRRLNRGPRPEDSTLVLTPSGKVKEQPKDMSSDVIAAAITALHLHRQNIEERRRLLLTFKRSRADHWRSSGFVNMPNRETLRKRS